MTNAEPKLSAESGTPQALEDPWKGWTRSGASRARIASIRPSGSGLTSLVGSLHTGDGQASRWPRRRRPALQCSWYGSDSQRSVALRTAADHRRTTAAMPWHRRHHGRQNIQLHWVTIEACRSARALAKVGLNTMSACGDVTRNSRAAVAGVDAMRLRRVAPGTRSLELLAGTMSFTTFAQIQDLDYGCRVWCPYPKLTTLD